MITALRGNDFQERLRAHRGDCMMTQEKCVGEREKIGTVRGDVREAMGVIHDLVSEKHFATLHRQISEITIVSLLSKVQI